MPRACLRISGRVQGVGFRYAAAKQATSLGLAGWVRNLDNGDVCIAFEGSDSGVEAMLDWLSHGPPLARVDGLEPLPIEDGTLPVRFEIR